MREEVKKFVDVSKECIESIPDIDLENVSQDFLFSLGQISELLKGCTKKELYLLPKGFREFVDKYGSPEGHVLDSSKTIAELTEVLTSLTKSLFSMLYMGFLASDKEREDYYAVLETNQKKYELKMYEQMMLEEEEEE